MTIFRFDERQLVLTLERLSPRLRVIFAAACAERLLPAYEAFSSLTGRGDAGALTHLLAWLWESIASGQKPGSEADAKIDACMRLIPQEDEGPWVEEQASAEDAGAAVAYALRCQKNGESQEAAWAARRAYEALDHYVISREDIDLSLPGAEARVLAHSLVQAELTRQYRDLADLLDLGDEDVGDVAARLRDQAKREGSIFFRDVS